MIQNVDKHYKLNINWQIFPFFDTFDQYSSFVSPKNRFSPNTLIYKIHCLPSWEDQGGWFLIKIYSLLCINQLNFDYDLGLFLRKVF